MMDWKRWRDLFRRHQFRWTNSFLLVSFWILEGVDESNEFLFGGDGFVTIQYHNDATNNGNAHNDTFKLTNNYDDDKIINNCTTITHNTITRKIFTTNNPSIPHPKPKICPSSLHRGKIKKVPRLLRHPLPHTHPHLFHLRRFPIDLGLVDHSHFGNDHHGGPGGISLFEEGVE